MTVDQERCRQAGDRQCKARLAGAIDVNAEVLDADVGVEIPYDLGPAAVDRQGDDLEVWSAERCLQPVERRHLLPARETPGRPDIEENHLAAEVTKGPGFAFAIRELELRHRRRRLAPHEILWRIGERRSDCGDNGNESEGEPSHDWPPFTCRRNRSMSGRIVSSSACSVIGPICLYAMRPSAPITKVSGIP